MVGVVVGVAVRLSVRVAPLFDGGVVGLGGGDVDARTDVEVLRHPALGADKESVVGVGVGDVGGFAQVGSKVIEDWFFQITKRFIFLPER